MVRLRRVNHSSSSNPASRSAVALVTDVFTCRPAKLCEHDRLREVALLAVRALVLVRSEWVTLTVDLHIIICHFISLVGRCLYYTTVDRSFACARFSFPPPIARTLFHPPAASRATDHPPASQAQDP